MSFINERLCCPQLDTTKLFFYLASLLYPKHLAASPIWQQNRGNFETLFCEKAGEDEAFLNDCLYSFSLERLELAMKDKYVATMFSSYAAHEEKHITTNKTMTQNIGTYRKAFSILKKHAAAGTPK